MKSNELPANCAPFDLEALDDRRRARRLAQMPPAPNRSKKPWSQNVCARASRKRNSNATPRNTSAEQHEQHREIHRRDDDGEGQRKGREQCEAAEHEPCLVAVPDRRDRVHDEVARLQVGLEAVEDADAEIEAVEQHIEEDAGGEDDRPERDEDRAPRPSCLSLGLQLHGDRLARPPAFDRPFACRSGLRSLADDAAP